MYKVLNQKDKIIFATEIDGSDVYVRFFPNGDNAVRGKAIVIDDFDFDSATNVKFIEDEEVPIDVRVEVFVKEYGISWMDNLDELIDDSFEMTVQVATRLLAPLDYVEMRSRKISSYAPGVGACVVVSKYAVTYEGDEGVMDDIITVVSIEGDGDDEVLSVISIEGIDGVFEESFEDIDMESETDNDADLSDLDDEDKDYYYESDDEPDSFGEEEETLSGI